MSYEHVVQETRAIQAEFRKKRDRMIAELERIGVRFDRVPDGTFYAWGNVADLPPPLDDGMGLFRAALERKVITVPGEFFDVNPGKRRRNHGSRFASYVRFSFGPPAPVLDRALERLGDLVRNPPAP
jgi:N-succinyldiaminopimelate aminotransferase